ncbi:tungstate transport system ATP-binding protein [Maridesulfovibrio ferrireducens]|uniref:Tungstate transport system ATP-binding protein n=1 Tax=Maridesulfovibrio ferrireducens TaxID=246191 RepID=A0A1G9FI70_9BACT|nr:ABC transporter ATP-binding protein [Maridesulfovibrio ferrireducens]SDK88037.1 tungstate transport system ATP-binding protein [Maridesulfovibrio ferrireducens]
MSNILYKLSGVTQCYSDKTVLNLDDFTVSKGAIIGLAGHNGSGKSTLMRILAFLESPVSGEIIFDGKKIETADIQLRRKVTLLTQEPYLLKRTVAGNVAYGLELRGATHIESKVRESLSLVGLEPDIFMSRQWYELSGGEAQRVALAARLAINPMVLLLDEPTASLDRESTLLIHEAAVKVREKYGTTLVIVSHDYLWLEDVADKIITFSQGKIKN